MPIYFSSEKIDCKSMWKVIFNASSSHCILRLVQWTQWRITICVKQVDDTVQHSISCATKPSMSVQQLLGARLYFTVTAFGQMSSGTFGSRLSGMMSTSSTFYPSILCLVHVRLPPGFTVGIQHRPANVHSAFYRQGRSVFLPFSVPVFVTSV